jgi:hypothetical protein
MPRHRPGSEGPRTPIPCRRMRFGLPARCQAAGSRRPRACPRRVSARHRRRSPCRAGGSGRLPGPRAPGHRRQRRRGSRPALRARRRMDWQSPRWMSALRGRRGGSPPSLGARWPPARPAGPQIDRNSRLRSRPGVPGAACGPGNPPRVTPAGRPVRSSPTPADEPRTAGWPGGQEDELEKLASPAASPGTSIGNRRLR